MKTKFTYPLGVIFVRLFKLAAPYKFYIAGSAVASVIGNMAHMGLMGFGAAFLLCCGNYMEGNALIFALLSLLCAVLIPAGRYFEGMVSHVGAYKLLADMRVEFFDRMRELAPAGLLDREKGDLMNIAISDVETVETFFAHTIGPMFTVVLLPLTTLIVAACFHPLYALVLLPVYLIISVIIPLLSMKAGRSIGMAYRKELAAVKSLVLESVYGIKDIQIFGMGDLKKAQADESNRRVNKAAHRLILYRQAVSAAPTFFIYVARILVLVTSAFLLGRALGGGPGAVLVSFVAMASFSSTFSLTKVVSSLLEAFAAAERIFIVEDTVPETSEPKNPEATGPVEEISWENITFSYPGTKKKVLENFTLRVKKGEKIGIYGMSGAGKSTIYRLLLGFWNPQSGKILINGHEVSRVSRTEIHKRFAVLEQETFLTSGTLAENIALGKPGATDKEIRLAARRAGLSDFIESLPLGYNTRMGEMGARLSGGEKQRVGIARIMLLDPDVIIMDEPTSSLDVFHEKELLDTLSREYASKTIIMISHRPSTLTDCTRLIKVGAV